MGRLKFVIVLFSVCVTLCSCVKKTRYERALNIIDSLKDVNSKLMLQNEELLNGEERLVNYIRLYSDSNNYLKAYEKLLKLRHYHPESNFLLQNKEMFAVIEKNALHKIDSIKKFKADSVRIANINELGVWKIGDYVNDFDEKTGDKYVDANFYGYFSNSATASDILRVYVRIDKYQMTFKYDEYDNGTYEDEVLISAQVVNKDKRKKYITENFWGFVEVGDDNTYSKDNICGIDKILIDEGVYDFHMRFKYKTEYKFSINSSYLNNALIKAGLKDLSDF